MVYRRKRSYRRRSRRRARRPITRRRITRRVRRTHPNLQYDGTINMKCTREQNITTSSDSSGFHEIMQFYEWGTQYSALFGTRQWTLMSPMYQEWRIVGMKITFLPVIGGQVYGVSSTGATPAFTPMTIQKGSFRSIINAPATADVLQETYDYKEVQFNKPRSFWIRLDKYWDTVNGQRWLRVGDFYQAAGSSPGFDRVAMTAFGLRFSGVAPSGTAICRIRTDYYIKLRAIDTSITPP